MKFLFNLAVISVSLNLSASTNISTGMSTLRVVAGLNINLNSDHYHDFLNNIVERVDKCKYKMAVRQGEIKHAPQDISIYGNSIGSNGAYLFSAWFGFNMFYTLNQNPVDGATFYFTQGISELVYLPENPNLPQDVMSVEFVCNVSENSEILSAGSPHCPVENIENEQISLSVLEYCPLETEDTYRDKKIDTLKENRN
jgi:hypothetical protein